MADLNLNTPVSVGYTGAAVTYDVKSAGQVTVHMWGGAGAGGYYSNGSGQPDRRGGAGGYATVRFMAEEGDVLTLEVGQGGQVASGSGAVASAGGNGGWPDGGYGGKSSSNTSIGFGGGGGSSRLYKNGELIAIAGAGGGATGLYFGGNGGGVNGLASTDTFSGAGGTQTAGGATGTGVAAMSGAYFLGGKGSAVQATAATTAGAGGGGGYYGGASNSSATAGAGGSGGGGAGYINSNTLYQGALKNGPVNSGLPYDVAGIRASGIAEGGTGPTATASWNLITPGGNGQIYMTLLDPLAAADSFPNTDTTFSYTGERQTYLVGQLSSAEFEMWGGGGGGGFYTSGGNTGIKGGAAGYTKFTRILYPGDIVEIEVGQGGQVPSGVSQAGGIGGWPNGGDGGCPTNAAPNLGAGGGSSNIYINGRLVAVAAGGGGATGFYHGGNGGGRYGLTDTASANNGSGGTWAGIGAGLNRGYYLMGGHGSPLESTTIAISTAGAGGGGGYYGGGGARGGANTHGSGGGGCGYISGEHTYDRDMQAGAAQSGVPYNTANRPAGIGEGGACGTSNATTTAGANGAIVVAVTAITPDALPEDKTALSFTGAPVHYIADQVGVLSLKVWGAGGAAGQRSDATVKRGGGGGFLQIPFIKISPGDVLTCVVGEGGKAMQAASSLGRGGFPNGGTGGAGDVTGGSSGGGGSSHVYLNGKLLCVAGGGGGGSISYEGYSAGRSSYPASTGSGQPSGASLTYGGYAPNRSTEGTNRSVFMLAGDGQADGVALSTPNPTVSGGGGGGGYYGGASGASTGSAWIGGGAGTTYINPLVTGTSIQATTSGSNISDADWVSGVSAGGLGSSTIGNPVLAGGNGRIVLDFDVPPLLQESIPQDIPVQSQVQTYVVGADGALTLKAWGGGGGGCVTSLTPVERAAGGGYATAKLDVTQGQIVRFINGRGGGGGNWTSGAVGSYVGSGGYGGWPDGGQAGMHVSGLHGGGGGSSRVYVDDMLVLVAGGGGGLGVPLAGDTAGGGGGAQGQNSDAPNGQNTGGLTYQGGLNTNRPTDAGTSGGPFKGGVGYIAAASASTSSTLAGGGGGGGLYGGAGSGSANGSQANWMGGAGGSGYISDSKGITADDPYRNLVAVQYSWETNGGVADDARAVNTALLDTAPVTTTTGPKFGTTCLQMSAGHLTAPVPAIGTQDYTLEGWFKPTSVATGVLMILGNNSIGGISLHYFPEATTLGLRFNNVGNGANDTKYTDSGRQANVWAHYAICRDVNGTRVYKNGILVSTTPGAPLDTTATTLTLGNYNARAGASTRFVGKIDEVRLTIGVARYRQNFQPTEFRNTFPIALTTSSTAQANNTGATNSLPAGTAETGYLTGRGVGADAVTTPSQGHDGGDGQINYYLATSTVGATGPIGTITVSPVGAIAGVATPLTEPGTTLVADYTAQLVSYEAAAAGTTRILVELWGAGGGGVSSSNTGGGGGGGYTSYEVDLEQGDRISVQTASGGQGSNSANTVAATNPGGYPDGGSGYAPSNTVFNGGAGGGSRLYVRGVLAAVAGGGGGGAYGSAAYQYFGGPGGGTSGGDGTSTGGGTQSAGGAAAGTGISGSFLQGGNGGTTPRVANNGPGGGGGYYGGGGGGAMTGGGGGSGYVNTSIVGFRAGSTQAGSGNLAAGQSSPNYVSGIGRGTTGVGPQVGGNGLVVISNITPTPAATSGDLGPEIAVTPITSFGLQIGLPVSQPNAIVTIEPPQGYYGFPGFPEMQPFDQPINILPVESSPTSNALIIVPINDSQSITLTPPQVEPFMVSGEGIGDLGPDITITAPDGSVPNTATGDLGTAITLEAPSATTDVIPAVETSGDIGTIMIEPPTGDGSINYNGYAGGDIGTVLIASLDGSADPGNPHVIEDMPPAVVITPPVALLTVPSNTSGDLGSDIILTAPDVFTGIEGNAQAAISEIQVVATLVSVNASTGDDVQVFADPGLIFVRPPLGEGLEITEANYVDGLPSPLVINYSAPEGSARGDVLGSDFLPVIPVSAPEPYVEVPAAVQGYTGDFIILSTPPQPVYDSAANLNVALPSAIVINGNDAEPSLDVTVDMPGPITLTAPLGYGVGIYGAALPAPIVVTTPEAAIYGNASGTPGTIVVSPPESFVETPAETTGDFVTVVVSTPTGEALGGYAAEGTGSLPTISVIPVEGGNVAEAAVNVPISTVFVNAPVPLPRGSVAISGLSNTINVLAPVGDGHVSTTSSGELAVITVVTPTGIGYLYEEGFASGDVGTIVVTAPDSDQSAESVVAYPLPTVLVSHPNALPVVPGEPNVSLPTIYLEAPEGLGFPDTVTGTGDIGTVDISPVLGMGMVPAEVAGTMPSDILLSAPNITRVNVTGDIGVINIFSPAAQVTGAVDLAQPIDVTISLTAPDGQGYPVIPGEASGDLGQAILITASDGTAHGDYELIVNLPSIQVTAPESIAEGSAEAVQQGELPIVVSSPVGEYYREASVVLGLSTIYIFAPNAVVSADDKTAAVTPELPIVYVQGVDGFAEVPVVDGTARIQFRRSMTPGAIPASLETREIAFNEIDGIMYSRDGSGMLRPTPWGTLRRESIPTVIGAAGQAYRADGAWAVPQPVHDKFVQGVPASGVRVTLGETFVGKATRTPTSGESTYSPFFVPRTVSITSLAVDIQAADMGVAQVGIVALGLDRTPADILVSGMVPTTSTGIQTAAATSIVLQPGWYATLFTYIGLGAPVFHVMEGPAQVANDFTTQQGTPSFILANLQ